MIGGRPLRRLAARAGLHVGSRRRHHLVPRHFYTPIPDVDALPDGVWARQSALAGISFDLAEQLAFAEQRLAAHARALRAPAAAPAEPGGFFLNNGSYQGYDAELLYAMVRDREPRRVIEVGSGYSTLVIRAALAAGTTAAEHTIVDPYPSPVVPAGADVVARGVERLPVSFFETLTAGDILFVDSSHTVKLGGDVNFLVLDVLPVLAPGVAVHFHDIFLPWEYPRWWLEQLGYYWNEQYLLQAFLAGNRDYRVLLATHALSRAEPERLVAIVGGRREANPSSFWIART